MYKRRPSQKQNTRPLDYSRLKSATKPTKQYTEQVSKSNTSTIVKKEHSIPQQHVPLLDHIPVKQRIHHGGSEELLKCAGNLTNWTSFSQLIKQHTSVMVWGPTGCGKSEGVKLTLESMKLNIYELNPSVIDNSEDLKNWLTNVAKSKTLLGKRVIVIDDIEGLDDVFVKLILQFSQTLTLCDSRLVIICTDKYCMKLKQLRHIPSVKLFRPNEYSMVQFGEKLFPTIPKVAIKKCAQRLHGDLRQLTQQLQMNIQLKTDQQNNIFEDTDLLLRGNITTDKWLHTESESILQPLLHANYLSLPNTNLDYSQLFSDIQGLLHDYSAYVLGQSFWQTQKQKQKIRLEFKPFRKPTKNERDPDDIQQRLRYS